MNSGYQVDGLGRVYKKAYEVESNVYGIERTYFQIENESAIAEIDEVLLLSDTEFRKNIPQQFIIGYLARNFS